MIWYIAVGIASAVLFLVIGVWVSRRLRDKSNAGDPDEGRWGGRR